MRTDTQALCIQVRIHKKALEREGCFAAAAHGCIEASPESEESLGREVFFSLIGSQEDVVDVSQLRAN